ncbi:galactose oxidase-like domain-containing protein, partial [Hyphomicrobium sp.]|uniref:galactose oxidase-like domain-containing protein n=1 Tax=Hyphomicrobium sp. TaxID=82 RepID=UPI003F6E564B
MRWRRAAVMADDWSNVFSWPLIAIHSILTPDGKVLTFGSNQSGQQGAQLYYDVFDPVTNTHNTLTHTTATDLFCCAAVIVPGTGEILLVGGDARPLGSTNAGVPDVNIYRYQDTSIQASPTGPMDFARWYGTAISLPTGQVFAIGGSDETYKYNGYSEIYTPGLGWRTLTGAYIDEYETSSNYPRTWVAFDGQIITFKPGDPTVYAIDPTGSGSVHAVAELPFTTAWWQPAVMFDVDRVLILANDGFAWIMDISGSTPTFQRTDAVGLDRIWSNLTVLPDGRVLLTGGSSVDASSNNTLTNPNYTAAIWDPDTGDWTIGDSATVPRLYHSTTLLLPDGTVLSLGGGAPGPVTNLNGERYTPDYLFDASGNPAVRPVISGAPGELHAGDTFTITVTGPDSIDTLALLAFGATTHSFDMSARRIELHFTTLADGTLSVELPDNANVLTPGYWMLFAIDDDGTPSVASTVHIQVDQPFYLPGATKLNLGVGLETNGRAAYDGYSDTLVLTPNGANKSGSVMSETRVDLRSAFSISFEINVGANDAASDGLA